MIYIKFVLLLLIVSACPQTALVTPPNRQEVTTQTQSTQTPSVQDPSQLGTRQIEVRTLDVPYEHAYRAATQAFFSIGFSITHSDKASGILTGSRTVGVTQMKQEVQQAKKEAKEYREHMRQEQAARSVLGFVPYVGWVAGLIPGSQPPAERDIKEPSSLQATMLLQPSGEKQTQIRFKMQKDGEPVWDQVTIDKLWVTTQREAMIESGPLPVASNAQPASGQNKK